MGREKKGREAACPNNKKSFPRPWPVNNGAEEKKGEEERRGEGGEVASWLSPCDGRPWHIYDSNN